MQNNFSLLPPFFNNNYENLNYNKSFCNTKQPFYSKPYSEQICKENTLQHIYYTNEDSNEEHNTHQDNSYAGQYQSQYESDSTFLASNLLRDLREQADDFRSSHPDHLFSSINHTTSNSHYQLESSYNTTFHNYNSTFHPYEECASSQHLQRSNDKTSDLTDKKTYSSDVTVDIERKNENVANKEAVSFNKTNASLCENNGLVNELEQSNKKFEEKLKATEKNETSCYQTISSQKSLVEKESNDNNVEIDMENKKAGSFVDNMNPSKSNNDTNNEQRSTEETEKNSIQLNGNNVVKKSKKDNKRNCAKKSMKSKNAANRNVELNNKVFTTFKNNKDSENVENSNHGEANNNLNINNINEKRIPDKCIRFSTNNLNDIASSYDNITNNITNKLSIDYNNFNNLNITNNDQNTNLNIDFESQKNYAELQVMPRNNAPQTLQSHQDIYYPTAIYPSSYSDVYHNTQSNNYFNTHHNNHYFQSQPHCDFPSENNFYDNFYDYSKYDFYSSYQQQPNFFNMSQQPYMCNSYYNYYNTYPMDDPYNDCNKSEVSWYLQNNNVF